MTRTGDLVLAHAFGERDQLPIPLWLFVIGGAAVVVLSFLLVLRRGTAESAAPVQAPDTVPAAPRPRLAGALAVAVTLFVAFVGLTGTQETSYNIAPIFFWLLVWIVVPLSCGAVGDWTRPVNPFAVLARLGDDAGLRKAVLARREPLEWSPRLGWWPAVVLFVLLVLGELVFNLDTTKPAFVGGVLVLYAVLSLFLGLLFGPSWLARGEVFSGLFNAWGRLGFFRFGAPGRRGFAGGLEVPFEPAAGRTVFVLLLLISINFDGLLATPQWADYERRTIGIGTTGVEAFRVASLLVLIVVVLTVFGAFAYAASRVGGSEDSPLRSLSALLPSLVPIAYGYLIAHYLQYLIVNGQLIIPLLSNPGFGGGRGAYTVNETFPPSRFYWYLSVVVIVAVHVVAVFIAHRVLRSRARDERSAVRSELPWLVAMVGYTAFSLFLIAQPLVESGPKEALGVLAWFG